MYKMNGFLSLLDGVEGAREGSPLTEGDGPGLYLAEQIEDLEFHQDSSSGPLDRTVLRAPGDGRKENSEDDRDEDPDEESAGQDLPIFRFPADKDPEKVLDRLAGARGDEYEREVLARGVDALAYYMTFHQKVFQWGIYVPITGLAWVARNVFQRVNRPATEKIALSLSLVLAHERFHFAADCCVAQMELFSRKPLYWPVARSTSRTALRDHEEEVANAHMVRIMRGQGGRLPPGAYRDILDFVRMQSGGYQRGEKTARSRFVFENRMLDLAQGWWLAGWGKEANYGVELNNLFPVTRPFDLRRCPVHIIHDERRFGLEDLAVHLIQVIPAVAMTSKFTEDLDHLGKPVKRRWEDTVEKLRTSVQLKGLDFKPWRTGGDDVFSVRVTRDIRAHIRFDPLKGAWIADRIGRHKEMGHG